MGVDGDGCHNGGRIIFGTAEISWYADSWNYPKPESNQSGMLIMTNFVYADIYEYGL